MIAGKENANVFPEPVKAIPIISLPENLFDRKEGLRKRWCLDFSFGGEARTQLGSLEFE